MTISAEAPPTLEELRARPVGRTGAELVLRLRLEMLLVEWDPKAEVFSVTDTGGRLVMVLGTAGPLHSAVVHQALAAAKRWEPPARRDGFSHWPAEKFPHGNTLFAVIANDWPVAIGQGDSGAAALRDLARIRETVSQGGA